MTNKEAINILSSLPLQAPSDSELVDIQTAVRMATKALEFQHKYQFGNCEYCKHNGTNPTQYPCCVCGDYKVSGFFEMWEETEE